MPTKQKEIDSESDESPESDVGLLPSCLIIFLNVITILTFLMARLFCTF